MKSIDEYRRKLAPETLAMVDELRGLAAGSHADLTEAIKWNAPSFAMGDEHRITLGLDAKGNVRVVLHRDAKVKDSAEFRFDDADRLATWPAPDRGVMTFKDRAEIDARREALASMFRRWIEATT